MDTMDTMNITERMRAIGEAARALKDIGYTGYVSAEAFAWPDPDAAAEQTIQAFKEHFG